jgi:hypothetical protein
MTEMSVSAAMSSTRRPTSPSIEAVCRPISTG